MDQAAFGARMGELRPGWSRSTVVKLENNKRTALPIDDLPALALALGVPLVMLLADPYSSEPVPIADGIELPPWEALLWMAGVTRFGDGVVSHPLSTPAQRLIFWGSVVAQIAGELLRNRPEVFTYPVRLNMSRQELDDQQREQAAVMRDTMKEIAAAGAPVPQVPARVRERVAELGVELPGQEG